MKTVEQIALAFMFFSAALGALGSLWLKTLVMLIRAIWKG